MRLYRIGLFTDVYLPNPNGVSTSIYLLLRELRRMGHDAWVMAPEGPNDPTGEEAVVRIPSVAYPFFEGQRLAMPSSRYLPTKFEIIHTHTPLFLGMWGSGLARRRGIPHVSTFHTHYEKYAHYIPGLAVLDRYTGVIQSISRAFYNRCEVVIAPTEPVKALVESYGVERPIRVIPTGVDTDILEQAPEVPSPWPEGKRRLITVGRLGKEKSFEVVIEALALVRQHLDAYLVHVGEGPEEAHLKAYAAKLGVLEHVTFVGAVPYRAIGGYYRHAEVFVFASETETQGLVLWEAQAMGVPVVAVGAEGTLQGVDEGRSGYLVPPRDAAQMARRALEVLADDALRQRLSQGARKFAEARSARRIAEDIVGLYDEATEIQQIEPKKLIFPFPRLPRSSLPSSR
ncbi:Alpha-monoglucosyldiacylglycerol synthase [Calidithermus terrae]|uniref:Alpha-monoglucosyldiacylglycerol synthase n=1 Tax=Calidithermus terrae TaxID=1408545 RepID=A0A399EQ62_9DEIN|nr:glycosyltransferase family 4 protein [Calidithermus terrae]RIH86005.1 Alpha-monoglucosyldiacylglycerol synthase [Calidithermus terrae]